MEENKKEGVLNFDGKEYVLKYNMKRIEMIEEITDMPTLAEMNRTKGMLGIKSLRTYFTMALKESGSDSFVKPKLASEIFEGSVEAIGYQSILGFVLYALERDCPFFFQAD